MLPKSKAKRLVMRLVGDWKERLGLVGWKIFVQFEDAEYLNDDERVRAQVSCYPGTKSADLSIALRVSDEELRQFVAHEMLHVALTDLRETAKASLRQLSPQTIEILSELLNTKEEQLVTQLVTALEMGIPQ